MAANKSPRCYFICCLFLFFSFSRLPPIFLSAFFCWGKTTEKQVLQKWLKSIAPRDFTKKEASARKSHIAHTAKTQSIVLSSRFIVGAVVLALDRCAKGLMRFKLGQVKSISKQFFCTLVSPLFIFEQNFSILCIEMTKDCYFSFQFNACEKIDVMWSLWITGYLIPMVWFSENTWIHDTYLIPLLQHYIELVLAQFFSHRIFAVLKVSSFFRWVSWKPKHKTLFSRN